MTFNVSRFDHDYSLHVLGLLSDQERADMDTHVTKLNSVAAAWASADPAPGSRKAFEKSYYAIGAALRARGASYPAL